MQLKNGSEYIVRAPTAQPYSSKPLMPYTSVVMLRVASRTVVAPWAQLHATERNPRSRFTRELVHRVARDLKAAGWRLKEVTTDNGSEFRAREFGEAVEQLGARQRFIKAGRPDSNGCVERLQLTILEECWRPAFARSLAPKSTALERDLDEYLDYFNFDRAHNGRLTKGRIPAHIVHGARKTRTVR